MLQMEKYFLKDKERWMDKESTLFKTITERQEEDVNHRMEMSPADKQKILYGDKRQGRSLVDAKKHRMSPKWGSKKA